MNLLPLVEDRAVNIRPEFLKDECQSIQAYICKPVLSYLRPSPLPAWIVEAGNARRGAGTYNFRGIERFIPRIRSSNQYAGERISSPLNETATAQSVVARILLQYGGEDEFDVVVLDCLVSKGVPLISAVTGSALVKFRVRVLCLADTCQNTCKNECRIVEAVQRCSNELVFHGLRRQLLVD